MNYKLKETDRVIGLDSEFYSLAECVTVTHDGWEAIEYPPFNDWQNSDFHSTTVKMRTVKSDLIQVMFL